MNSSRDDRALIRVRTPRGLTRISREACCRVIGIKMANGASIKGLTDFRLLSSRAYKPMDEPTFVSTFSDFIIARRRILSIHPPGSSFVRIEKRIEIFFIEEQRSSIEMRTRYAKKISIYDRYTTRIYPVIRRRIKFRRERWRLSGKERNWAYFTIDGRAPNMRIGRPTVESIHRFGIYSFQTSGRYESDRGVRMACYYHA